MNEHELDLALALALADFGGTRVRETAPTVLRERIRTTPLHTTARRGWLPSFPTWRFPTTFSAVKFVVAGVIVALFGGFLLTGVFTTQQDEDVIPAAVTDSPSPTTTDELLAGMVTEEIEPGVLQIVNDGERDLATGTNRDIVAGRDGGIWLLRTKRFLRLGDDEGHSWHDDDRQARSETQTSEFEVAPDGTVWAAIWNKREGTERRVLGSYDGQRWRAHRPSEDLRISGLEVAPDGRVWTSWYAGGASHGPLGILGPDGWRMVQMPWNTWRITRDGDPISWEWSLDEDYRVDVKRYVDGTWQDWRSARLESAPTGLYTHLGGSEVYAGSDGTVWAFLHDQADFTYLMRLDGEGKREWGPADGTPSTPLPLKAVAPDGSFWGGSGGDVCDGVTRFDGETWDRYLRDLCVHRMDVADDGSVWLLAGTEWTIAEVSPDGATYPSPARTHLYVVTPEAMAANE